MVRTTVDSLRIRRGPGISYPETGVINEKTGSKKKYTIIEEQNGLGPFKVRGRLDQLGLYHASIGRGGNER